MVTLTSLEDVHVTPCIATRVGRNIIMEHTVHFNSIFSFRSGLGRGTAQQRSYQIDQPLYLGHHRALMHVTRLNDGIHRTNMFHLSKERSDHVDA